MLHCQCRTYIHPICLFAVHLQMFDTKRHVVFRCIQYTVYCTVQLYTVLHKEACILQMYTVYSILYTSEVYCILYSTSVQYTVKRRIFQNNRPKRKTKKAHRVYNTCMFCIWGFVNSEQKIRTRRWDDLNHVNSTDDIKKGDLTVLKNERFWKYFWKTYLKQKLGILRTPSGIWLILHTKFLLFITKLSIRNFPL